MMNNYVATDEQLSLWWTTVAMMNNCRYDEQLSLLMSNCRYDEQLSLSVKS